MGLLDRSDRGSAIASPLSPSGGGGGGGGGTVTSVAVSVPSFLSVAGSPITTSGTIAISLSGTALPVTSGGTGTSTAFTAGSILFAGASGVYAQDNANFFWDDTNNRLGIGITTPNAQIQAFGAAALKLHLTQNTPGNASAMAFSQSTDYVHYIGAENSTGTGLFGSGDAYGLSIGTVNAHNINFHTNNVTTPRLKITSTVINASVNLAHLTAGTAWTIQTANNGAGNSGSLILRSGTATGTRGSVQLAADSIVLGDIGAVTVTPSNGGNLGTNTAPWQISLTASLFYSATFLHTTIGAGTTPTGVAATVAWINNSNTPAAFYTVNQSGTTESILFETGNSSATNSGDMRFTIGTAAGTQGSFKFLKSGLAPSVGDVWTASNADGSGYWAAPSPGAVSGAKIAITGPITDYSAGATQVPFTTSDQVFNTGSVIGTNQMVVQATGFYTICGQAYSPTNNPLEFVALYYSVNAGTITPFSPTIFGSAASYANSAGVAQLSLTATDTVEFYAYANISGGAIGGVSFSILQH